MKKSTLVALVFHLVGQGATRVAAQEASDAWGHPCPPVFCCAGGGCGPVRGLVQGGLWAERDRKIKSRGWIVADRENLRNNKLFVEIIRDDRAQKVERARGFRKVGFFVPDVEMVADRVAQATGE